MTTNFADISHHQASVDLAAYKAAGHDRIVMKATEATGFTDPMFAIRWVAAGKLGLARVAYHFARARFNGADEFDHFWSVVQAAGGLGPRDRVCLDVEDTDTPDRAAANAREFTAAAVAHGVTTGIVYTYNWYATHHAITPGQFPAGWRNMWMADYTVGQADSDIELGAGWTFDQVVARQYTDRAIVAGIGSTDYNRVDHEWLTVSAPPVPDDPTPIRKGNHMLVTAGTGTVLVVGDQKYSLPSGAAAQAIRVQLKDHPWELDLRDTAVFGDLGARVLAGTPQA